MIHWLIQSTNAHSNLSRAVPPPKLLTTEEHTQFVKLKTDKRRRDWLLGRWTAKHLLQALHEKQTGHRHPMTAFQISNASSGAPQAHLCGSPCYSISISHSAGHALCVATPNKQANVGADIEFIEPRSDAFVMDYFTDAELNIVCMMSGAERDVIATAIWSAKQAVLKTLGLGLIVDTRAVSCHIEPAYRAFTGWTPFNITLDQRHLQVDHGVIGWWRIHNNFVVTVAASQLQLLQPVDYRQVQHWN
jgi:4'-phosphopantetheinyl transferase